MPLLLLLNKRRYPVLVTMLSEQLRVNDNDETTHTSVQRIDRMAQSQDCTKLELPPENA
jgi:hypothetical protein